MDSVTYRPTDGDAWWVWEAEDHLEFGNAVGLANWTHYWYPKACDTLHHVAAQALADGENNPGVGLNDLFPRVWFYKANFREGIDVDGGLWTVGDTLKFLDPARQHYVILRENFPKAVGSQKRFRQFRSLMHEFGHIAGYDHDDSPPTDSLELKCATRNVNAEDLLKAQLPIPSAEVTSADLSCVRREEFRCYEFTLTEAPPWEPEWPEGEDEDSPGAPKWCGNLGITAGDWYFTAYACTGRAFKICHPVTTTTCHGSAAREAPRWGARLAERGPRCPDAPPGLELGTLLATADPGEPRGEVKRSVPSGAPDPSRRSPLRRTMRPGVVSAPASQHR